MRTRDRKSAEGLLPRMEARPLKGGGFSFRYHPVGGKPIALGRDRLEACRRVLDMNGRTDDTGTFKHVWRLYQQSRRWTDLSEYTRVDYGRAWKQVDKVFGDCLMVTITQPLIRRYMMVERGGIKRANTEASLISNLYKVAIDHNIVASNPCVGLEFIAVKPRKAVPIEGELEAFLGWLRGKGKQWRVIAAMAAFAAAAGPRRVEFREATVFEVKGLFDEAQAAEARLARAKQRGGRIEVVDVIELTPDIVAELRAVMREGCTTLFPTRAGRPYTDNGFNTMWQRAKATAKREGIITLNFTFHDLRAYYTTKHKRATGELPDLHKNPETTARVYDRTIEVKRRAV